MSDTNAILFLSCPDQEDFGAAVSNFTFRQNGDMAYADRRGSRLHMGCGIRYGGETVIFE
ncbi:MAG TPA: hypothetical protein PK425_10405 [Syntrophales bacterium]|jgi:hypothetical protein|nr:hypothetical protein [Syntrophales bacterium]HPX56936.1 hypothetical protein [Syntrophales bacterium]